MVGWWVLLFVAVNCLAYKELTETSDRCGISRPSGGAIVYVLFIFQFILHIKTAPLLLWSFEAVKPLKCFVGQTSPTFDWHGSKQIEGVEGAFWA